MNSRRGYSLIETLVMIAVGSVVMGVTVGVLCTLFRIERSAREHAHHGRALGRLADQFRRDVRAARAAPGGEPWRLDLPAGRSVTYRFEPGRLVRSQRAGDETRQQEAFWLPPGTVASIEGRDEAGVRLVSLWINPGEGRSGRSLRMDAVLAQDHRFDKP